MTTTAELFTDEDIPRARVALLLQHFSKLEDDREAWRVAYPLAEVLLLPTCFRPPFAPRHWRMACFTTFAAAATARDRLP